MSEKSAGHALAMTLPEVLETLKERHRERMIAHDEAVQWYRQAGRKAVASVAQQLAQGRAAIKAQVDLAERMVVAAQRAGVGVDEAEQVLQAVRTAAGATAIIAETVLPAVEASYRGAYPDLPETAIAAIVQGAREALTEAA